MERGGEIETIDTKGHCEAPTMDLKAPVSRENAWAMLAAFSHLTGFSKCLTPWQPSHTKHETDTSDKGATQVHTTKDTLHL